jgi:hypothetical protein
MSQPAIQRQLMIGPDQITVGSDQLVIEAKNPMPDWEVREFSILPIYFEQKRYYLAQQHKAEPPFSVCYLLKAWPENGMDDTRFFHDYSLDAVLQREEARRRRQVNEIGFALLTPFYPLLGLLWSGVQQRLVRFGLVPHTLTGVSIFTASALLLVQGVFSIILLYALVRSGQLVVGGFLTAMIPAEAIALGPLRIPVPLLDRLLVFSFLIDTIVRYSIYLRDDQWYGGFLEWIVRRAPRNELD